MRAALGNEADEVRRLTALVWRFYGTLIWRRLAA
jgi:hypothetical protein